MNYNTLPPIRGPRRTPIHPRTADLLRLVVIPWVDSEDEPDDADVIHRVAMPVHRRPPITVLVYNACVPVSRETLDHNCPEGYDVRIDEVKRFWGFIKRVI